MPEVKIGTPRSRTEITPEGAFEEYIEVEFYIDDARHHLRMSPIGFTAKLAEEAVRARAAELVAIQDKKITFPK
ncbi:unnamed protein product [marine sediment metagenome]|uniref:Uncharacterized protein n=1 Tax=marine sediment metagenome TaxID=412755 RepID=X1PKC0_9ZZZZ